MRVRSFNSRTPGGVRPLTAIPRVQTPLFQFTHPGRGATAASSLLRFQFTHPGRGATGRDFQYRKAPRVSIHAPREGCDALRGSPLFSSRCFNSRTPGGVRPHYGVDVPSGRGVSIHAPREGCDTTVIDKIHKGSVSIHAPREGCDCVGRVTLTLTQCFNSRTPGGVRLPERAEAIAALCFNSRTPGGVRLPYLTHIL